MPDAKIALPQVLIIGDFPFPTGSAASNNLRGHCQAIQAAGYSVGLLPAQDAGRPADRQPTAPINTRDPNIGLSIVNWKILAKLMCADCFAVMKIVAWNF